MPNASTVQEAGLRRLDPGRPEDAVNMKRVLKELKLVNLKRGQQSDGRQQMKTGGLFGPLPGHLPQSTIVTAQKTPTSRWGLRRPLRRRMLSGVKPINVKHLEKWRQAGKPIRAKRDGEADSCGLRPADSWWQAKRGEIILWTRLLRPWKRSGKGS